MTLEDAVVLVTGGTGALGSVVTERFLAEGSDVITTYIDSEEYDALVEQVDHPDRLTGYKVDVTADEQVEDLVTKVVDEYGRIDVLLTLVGGWKGGDPLHETGEDTWDSMLDLNLKSAFLTAKHVVPVMRDRGYGRIVTIGSKTGHELPEEGGPYAIAKHGVEALTAMLAKENADRHITANCILPSVIDTPANRETMGTDNVDDWVDPVEIADLIVDVVQDGATTGETHRIYGGIT